MRRAVVTPERPGPGPLPDALLRALELRVARRMEGLLAGDHRSAILGVGSELQQVRPYEVGDDVRQIDWNVTARTNEVHVRVHIAEAGSVEAVSDLAALISLCAQLRADGLPGDGEAWAATAATLGRGPDGRAAWAPGPEAEQALANHRRRVH